MIGHESLDCFLLVAGFALFLVLYVGKNVFCFFGIHAWRRDENGWTATCERCGRVYTQTPAGGFVSPSWVTFWLKGKD